MALEGLVDNGGVTIVLMIRAVVGVVHEIPSLYDIIMYLIYETMYFMELYYDDEIMYLHVLIVFLLMR